MTLTEMQRATAYTLKSKARIRSFVQDCELYPDQLESMIHRLQKVQEQLDQEYKTKEAKRLKVQHWKGKLLEEFPTCSGLELSVMLRAL